ncbi:MAG: DUF4838 domain-containing protein [Clostridia bacterium]|nr:DUF4838 domain-containing protein [Clostridia bacterium]
MKKFVSVVLTLIMTVSVAAFALFGTSAVTHGFLKYDANDDGRIDMKDVLAVRKYMASIYGKRDINFLAADGNEDKMVNARDLLMTRKVILNIEPSEGNNTDGEYKVDVVSVGDRNICRYTMVLPPDADECMEFSAEEFQDRLNEACGITLNITQDEASAKGNKIKFIYDVDEEYGLGEDGFRIKVEDSGDMLIWCGTKGYQRGSMYAVFHILEQFVGYRFLTADDYGNEDNGDVVYLYESEKATIPDRYAETIVPAITYRALAQRGISNTNFYKLHINDRQESHKAKYGWREGTLYIHAHSYAYQMAGIEHAYDWEWIERQGLDQTQPCLTDEETYQKIVEFNSWLIEDRVTWGTTLADGTKVGNDVLGRTYTQVSCSPNDNTDFCQCTDCKYVYSIEGSIAGTVFRLANRVTEKLEETYPDIETYTIAYWDARRPPKLTRPRDNICVCYCIGGCNNHPYDHTELCAEAGGNPRLEAKNWDGTSSNSSNVDDIYYYLGWTELTNNVQIWYYSALLTYFLSPAPNLFNVYSDIKFLASTGTTGVYFEGSGSAKYCFEHLRGYLATKMIWNPYMSEEEFNDLMNEYLMICYGDGWQYIRQYIDMSNTAGDLQGCWTNNFDRPWNVYNKQYYTDNYKDMAVLFDNAYDLAETFSQRKRVLNCRMQCDFLGLSATYERDWLRGDAAARESYKARYQNLYNYIKNNGVRVAGFSGTAGCDNFPTSANDIRDTMDWLWEGCNGMWNWDGRGWQ